MPSKHALLGPSSAHRWIACPPSARLSEKFPDTAGPFAEEGTLAHRLGELLLRREWEHADVDLKEVQNHPMYSPAMGEYMEGYAAFVGEQMAAASIHCPDPIIRIEQNVKFTEYVPDGFGTADCLIVADDVLNVIDLKYGKGVEVHAENNPQMMIYALGCYLEMSLFYDIKAVQMTIYQPRIDNYSTAVITVPGLLAWANDTLKPAAKLAWDGKGEFAPSEETCRWCKAAPVCRACRDFQLELAKSDFAEPDTLSEADIAELLGRFPSFEKWVKSVKDYALDQAVNHGVRFPGYKLVEGRSVRTYQDTEAIAAVLSDAGYTDIYKPQELLGITAMEKLVGKKKLNELAGKYIVKPTGAPTLVPESDKRPALNAGDDFRED